MKFGRRLAAAVAVPALIAGGAALAAGGTAHAAPTTVTGTTHVTNRPDSGNGGTWAYDTFGRTLTVTVAPVQNPVDTGHGLVDYTATVSDSGGFAAIVGVGTPNQFVPGTKILHGVHGSFSGGISYTVTAPTADTLAGTIPASENDNFSTSGAGFVTTANWPKLAFATPAGVTVTEGSTWSWTYKTATESWTDSAANGDGNTANDGNITGQLPVPPSVPYVYDGHVVSVSQHNAVVGWSDGLAGSAAAWKMGTVNGRVNHCVRVYVYGFDKPAGQAHIGFTCDNGDPAANLGYLRDLAAGHGVSLFVQPATGTYGHNQPIPGTDARAHVYVVTPA
jgi:hypothetical protein